MGRRVMPMNRGGKTSYALQLGQSFRLWAFSPWYESISQYIDSFSALPCSTALSSLRATYLSAR